MQRGWWILALALAAIGLACAWAFTPLRSVIDPRELLAAAERVRASGWGMLVIPPVFVVLSVVMVPSSILRWTTVLAFGPLVGVLCIALGVAGATFIGHWIGERVGAERMAKLGSARFERIRNRLSRTGVLGVAALRQVPLGPSMFVNAVGGAMRVPRRVFVVGTVVAMVPTVIVMLIAGASLRTWLLA